MKSQVSDLRKKIGLRSRLIITAFLVEVTVVAIAGVVAARGELRVVEEAMRSFYVTFAKSSAELCKDAMWSRDVLFLDDYVEAAKRDPNLLYLIIQDREGVVIASTDSRQIGKRLSDPISQKANEASSELVQVLDDPPPGRDHWLFKAEARQFDIAVPVSFLKEAEMVGRLRVGFLAKRVWTGIIERVGMLVLMILTVFAAGTFMGVWVDLKLRGNVQQLISVAGQMADGDLSQRVDIKTADDLEQLGNSFNKMAERIRQREIENQKMQAQISQYTAELENLVAGRTRELEKEKRRLDGIVGAVGAGLALLDRRKRILWANKTLETWFASLKGINGDSCYQTLWGEDSQCSDCPSERSFRTGRVTHGEKILARNGDTLYFRITSSPIKDAQGTVIEVVELIQDITDRKQMEAKLIQTAKLAAVGELAGGVAHEINNPIAIILAKSKLLVSNFGGRLPAKVVSDVEKIEKHAERVATIARGLLTFSRQSVGERGPTNINTILAEAVSLADHRLSVENMRVNMQLRPNLPSIRGNANELQQVIINMLNNAVDAMPDGGHLTITTDVASETDVGGARREYVILTIGDTGSGIPETIREKIFDPFFTTKEVGKGTGLGLSVSHGIVKSHGGEILVDSQAGKGTLFTVKLPCQS
ncbi:MAG: PAS domain-containing protein [Acidobacteria bacterium]|nr:PAS domain-containing protein [Acidobacteriota bacterium]